MKTISDKDLLYRYREEVEKQMDKLLRLNMVHAEMTRMKRMNEEILRKPS